LTTPNCIAELRHTLSTLEATLRRVGDTFRMRPGPRDFEHTHFHDIGQILELCRRNLERLDRELPRVPEDNNGLLYNTRTQLEINLKSGVIQQIVGRIASYNQVRPLNAVGSLELTRHISPFSRSSS